MWRARNSRGGLVPFPHDMRRPPRLDRGPAGGSPSRRYVLLVNPFYRKEPWTSLGKHSLTPSIALTSIAAATPPGWTVRYWDENLLQGPPPCDPVPTVVGITVHLTFARRAYELARWYRRRGATVVLGGLHVTTCPDEAAACADAIVIGEGIQVWPRVLADVEAGALKRRYQGRQDAPYRESPIPRRDVLLRGDYLTTAGLIATRGCHNRCRFCYLSTRGLHVPHQVRDVADVVAEVAATGEPYVVFTDNNLCSDREYLRALCRALRPLERIWSAAVSIDVTDDPSLVREMALAGCTGVFVGLESLTGRNLVAANKPAARPHDYARRVAILHRHGIQVTASFVFGFDDDRPDVFGRTIEWLEANRLGWGTFSILTPYPGTPLYRRLEAEGRILHRNWDLYNTAHAVFQPKHMAPEELEAGYAWCYERLGALRSVWLRRPERIGDLLPYLARFFLYKRMNVLWPFVIRYHLTHALWHPVVEAARRRHVRGRRRLASQDTMPAAFRAVPASV